ncbi:MAG: hypothetical protein NTV55_00930 [Planctomycetota bacterium]|nr:hypothetical protein [Planctomycetota bacterium]
MPIWDAVSLSLGQWDQGKPSIFGGTTTINNAYNCYIGSVLAFYIGEGRVTNVFGGETKIVFDWESVISSIVSMPDYLKLFMGGGDSTFVLGPSNKLNYYGYDFAVNRKRIKIEVKYGESEAVTSEKALKAAVIPLLIVAIITLGFVCILGTALFLRWEYKLFTSASKTTSNRTREAGILASSLIPIFEGAWLGILCAVENIEGTITGFKEITNWAGHQLIADAEAARINAAEIAAAALLLVDPNLVPVLGVNENALLGVQNEVGNIEDGINNNIDQAEQEVSGWAYLMDFLCPG